MIRDARVPRARFVPREVEHRDAEVNHLSSVLEPITNGEPADTAIVTGPSGVGKTCVSKFVTERLREEVLDVEATYVNCWRNYSRFRTLYQILDDIGATIDIHRQSTPHDEWELTESTLSRRDGDYYPHLGFRKPQPEKLVEQQDDAEDRTVLGVDLGITHIATTSTAYFASGRELRHRHREFERIRGRLQATGTQSAHRTIQQMSGRESRYVRDVLHRVANDILEEALAHDCEYIAFENLKHIRERAPPVKEFHQWAHRQLVDLVEYNSEAEGICVEFVSPRNTSRRCPDCGHTSKGNRVTQAEFECESCGATANADYVGAKNVGWRYVRRGLQSSRRTGESQLALKSGTVTPTRGFVPAD